MAVACGHRRLRPMSRRRAQAQPDSSQSRACKEDCLPASQRRGCSILAVLTHSGDSISSTYRGGIAGGNANNACSERALPSSLHKIADGALL